MTVAASYADGECPDCGFAIPVNAESGDACPNCGHVWYPSEAEMTVEQAERVNAAIKELWAVAEEAGLSVLCNDDEADDGTPQYVLTLEGRWPR